MARREKVEVKQFSRVDIKLVFALKKDYAKRARKACYHEHNNLLNLFDLLKHTL